LICHAAHDRAPAPVPPFSRCHSRTPLRLTFMNSTTIGRYLPALLIVNDEALIRSFLRSALETTARVIEAEDGEQALEILRVRTEATVDLVLVDHPLPKRSGLEVLQVTKRCWPWIPVVMITGFSSED